MVRRSSASRGFTLIELMIVVSIIGILALIAIPTYQKVRERAYDGSAIMAGRNAKMAQEVYYQAHQEDVGIGYTSTLSNLLRFDRNLTDDPDVTFIFSYSGQTNFTFTTSHTKGRKIYIYHD